MADTITKTLNNVKLKPTWTGTYTMTNTDADYLVSGENIVIGFQKLNSWIAKFDQTNFAGFTGVLPVTKGGTGLNTVAANSILVASAADTLTAVAPSGSQNEFLISTTGTGGNATPHFADAATTRSALGIDDAITSKLRDVHAMTIKGVVTPTGSQTDTQAITSYLTTNSITPDVGDIYLVDHTASGENFVEYVYVSDGASPTPNLTWEYIGKHEVGASDATYNAKGVVYLSDSTNGTQTAGKAADGSDPAVASDVTAATPLAVKTAKEEAIAAAKDARSKVTASASITSTSDRVYQIGSVSVTDSTSGVDGAAVTTTFYGQHPDGEKGVVYDTTSGKYKAALVSETANTYAVGSANAPELTAVQLDSNGKLAVAESKVKQNVFAFGTNDSNKGYYPLLFANSKITPSTDPPTTTAHVTGGTLATETGETNKYSHLFVQIDKNTVDNVTTETATLYADMFMGMTATPAINTDNSQLASTAFVHDVVDDALANGLANALVGAKGITIAKDTDSASATYGKYIVSHTHTDIAADTTGAFKKLKYDAQGHVTGTADVVTTDLAGLTGAITPATGDGAVSDKVLTAKTVSGTTTTQWEDWSVLELICTAD